MVFPQQRTVLTVVAHFHRQHNIDHSQGPSHIRSESGSHTGSNRLTSIPLNVTELVKASIQEYFATEVVEKSGNKPSDIINNPARLRFQDV
jgi:hypothetical protein